jgi:putative addiction module component (TIGR02574 family)
MIKTKKLIEEALALPVEERALMADSLLRSLNRPDAALEAQWVEVARRRRDELRAGEMKAIPGEEVFSEILERFNK